MQDSSLSHFETIARRTVATLPAPFAAPAREVALRVADWPSRDMLRDLGFRQVDIVHNPHRHPLRARHFAFASKRGTPLRPKIWP